MDIVEVLAVVFALGVPSMALATHLVLRPLIRDFLRLREAGDREGLLDRVARLEEVVSDLDRQVGRLVEAERFRRELEAGKSPRSSQ